MMFIRQKAALLHELSVTQKPLQAAINFALYSAGAKGVILCLFNEADLQNGRVSFEVALHPRHNKTGDVWHIALPQLDANLLYGEYAAVLCCTLEHLCWLGLKLHFASCLSNCVHRLQG